MKAVLKWLSPAGSGARLSVLIFHRVLAEKDPIFPQEPDEAEFDSLCFWLQQSFCVLPLAEAVERLSQGSLPARAAAITFDDGYADNLTLATPILQRHSLSATFFVATGFLDGGRMWNDTVVEAIRNTSKSELDLSGLRLEGIGLERAASMEERGRLVHRLLPRLKHLDPEQRKARVNQLADCCEAPLPNDLMLSTNQLCQLRASSMDIGAHTVNHPILATLDEVAAYKEMVQSKSELEERLGERVHLFAYPNGRPGEDFLPRDVALARRAGFMAAVTTAWGAADNQTDRYLLPRFTPWDRHPWKFTLRMTQNLLRRAA